MPAESLYARIYNTRCDFANIERFVETVSEIGELESAPPGAISARITDLVDELRPEGAITTETDATRKLYAEELARIAAVEFPDEGGVFPAERMLAEHSTPIKERLASVGLHVAEAPVRVVDEFPAPFHRFAWSAFAPDREDEERYGVPRGMYFRRDKLRPLYSEALLAHELIHVVTGRVDPEVYAMGLEEGIAEIVGTCYAGLAVLPAEVIQRIMIHGRHGVARPKLWSEYLDHTRQALLLLREFGLAGLAELVRRGRAEIKRAEAAVVAGAHERLDLPRGDFHEATIELVESVCLAYLPSLVFSPLEYLLLREVRAGASVDEVCRDADVPAEVGRPIMEKLGAKSALFVQDGADIGYSNVERYLDMTRKTGLPIIRYLPPERIPPR